MTLLFLAASFVGFVCTLIWAIVTASLEARRCAQWVRDRQERQLELQHREELLVVNDLDEGEVWTDLLNELWALPVYEGSRR
jgi:hypothetical protein